MKKLLLTAALALTGMVFCIPSHAKAASYDYAYVSETAMPGVQNYGQTTNVQITLQNTGTTAWERDSSTPMRLGTSHPQDGFSGFCTPPYYSNGWLPGCNRIQLPQAEVLPGQQVTFSFTIASPDYGGLINQYFQPVADGVTWMKDIGLYLGTTFPAPRGVLDFFWYGPGCNGWTPACGDATTNPVDTPSYGFQYNSDDPAVEKKQVDQMIADGINFVELDWWDYIGPTRSAANEQKAATDMANFIIANYTPQQMKFVFFDEPNGAFSGTQVGITAAEYNTAYNYSLDPHYMRYKGRPLIVTFYGRVDGGDTRFNVITLSNNRTSSGYPDWWTNAYQPTVTNGVTSIASRFDNTHWCASAGQACMAVDPTYSQDFMGQQMNYTLSARNSVQLLLENGWNEYYERQNWEPHTNPDSSVGATYASDRLANYNNNRWTQP